MTFVLIIGGIDPVGGFGVLALSGGITAVALQAWHWPAPAAAGAGPRLRNRLWLHHWLHQRDVARPLVHRLAGRAGDRAAAAPTSLRTRAPSTWAAPLDGVSTPLAIGGVARLPAGARPSWPLRSSCCRARCSGASSSASAPTREANAPSPGSIRGRARSPWFAMMGLLAGLGGLMQVIALRSRRSQCRHRGWSCR